jgi:hypothetical protein
MFARLFKFLRPASGITDSAKKLDRSYKRFMAEVRTWVWVCEDLHKDIKLIPYEKESHETH